MEKGGWHRGGRTAYKLQVNVNVSVALPLSLHKGVRSDPVGWKICSAAFLSGGTDSNIANSVKICGIGPVYV